MPSQIIDLPPPMDIERNEETTADDPATTGNQDQKLDLTQPRQDAFGDEEFAEVRYKVLKWW